MFGLTEHVGLIPPPIFRDRDVYLFLFICWLTPLNKTSFLKIFPAVWSGICAKDNSQITLDGVFTRFSDVAPDFLLGFCFGRLLSCDELSSSEWRE